MSHHAKLSQTAMAVGYASIGIRRLCDRACKKKSAKRLTRERLKRAHAQAHRCAPPRARMPSHILHYSPLFPDNFCNAKVVAASSSSPPRRTVARARLTRWCKTVQNQPAPDALFGNAFKSSYVCMYFVQGVSFKNAFSTTVQLFRKSLEGPLLFRN